MKDIPLSNSIRKHMGDVNAQDILFKYLYTTQDNLSLYNVHMLANYRVGSPPIGTATYFPVTKEIHLVLKKGAETLQAIGPL